MWTMDLGMEGSGRSVSSVDSAPCHRIAGSPLGPACRGVLTLPSVRPGLLDRTGGAWDYGGEVTGAEELH